ncbi:MAG TPA: two-component regulator propeller domain-containing protein [Pyrinomonadaceae bacterium]|jgi:ligand-binding sensor domain-containing protein/two-component sensor histidine kinase|nr:two-component regulator propeller domain-containing protein [Pyrinomonadaceae bacterium]
MRPSRSIQLLSLVCFLLLCGSGTAFALDLHRDLSRYGHDVWLTENGLPQNTVHSIAQTSDGYIWIGTEAGLARFDGVTFTIFDKQNTPQIKSNYIRALLADRQGALWIGTAEGLVRRLNGNFTLFTTNEGLPSNTIQAIYEDREGNLWVATATGLGLFKSGGLTTFTTRERLIGGSIQALFEDAEGALWIATPYGVGRVKDGAFTNYTVRDGLGSNSVRAIQQDRDGRLWFGSLGGLTSLSRGRFTTYTTRDGLPNERIISLYAGKDGALLVGTASGLCRFADGRFTDLNAGEALSTNTILSLLEDLEGNLWIGTESAGLNLLKDTKFTTYTAQTGLSGDVIKSIYQDHEGNTWIGTDGGGLNMLKDGKVSVYTTRDGLSSNVVLALFGDSGGNLWAGTPDGLSRYAHGKFTSFTAADGLTNNDVRSITADHSGNLWIGTRGGLTRMKEGEFKTFTEVDGLPNDLITTLYVDAKGALWIGTLGGLSRFMNNEFTTLTTRDGLTSDAVISLYEDSEDTLWIGTNGGGLNRLKDGKITAYTMLNGLLDDTVYRIMEDGRNNLWLSCRKGIFHIEKKALDDFANGRISSIVPVAYGTADGMITRECSGGGDPAGWKSIDGKLWFATIKGVAMIDPERIKINSRPPPVVIEQVRIDDQSITRGDRVELPSGARRLEFYYTAPSFVAPEKVRFKYKLEGFDKDWIDSGTRRIAYYTNLRPGSYNFRVIASNNDGVWNQTGAAFSLYLKPYFYQTYWFYAVCVLALLATASLLYRLRVRGMQRQFGAVLAERTRIAREIHDNLAQEMSGISVQLEVVARTMPADAESAIAHLDNARRQVRHGIAEARRYVWDLRSPALENNDLRSALSETARRLTSETDIEARVEVNGTFRPLPPLVEDNLLRIGQEAINNAVKHADPQEISVNLIFAARRVQLSVRDDGRGFDKQGAANGKTGHFGLIGMRERAEQLGGTFSVRSSAGGGTEVVADVPVNS